MIIKNPTSDRLEVVIKGVAYSVDADSELTGVPSEHAEHWKKHLHGFIEIAAEKNAADEEAKEVKEVKEAKPKK